MSRIWHQDLIQYLPTKQLEGMFYEICRLRGKGWNRKHITVDYIKSYPFECLVAFHFLVIKELEKRPKKNGEMHKIDKIWNCLSYRGKNMKSDFSFCTLKLEQISACNSLIYTEHSVIYLKECLLNLWNKYQELIKSDKGTWSTKRHLTEFENMFNHFNFNGGV